ncbi:hypothetical protein Thiosp_02630 [Thiorhodovibrio litoralis]|nr:hypothetical protein Thiosp_02630 [Thiorhodovibrio litoralis]
MDITCATDFNNLSKNLVAYSFHFNSYLNWRHIRAYFHKEFSI